MKSSRSAVAAIFSVIFMAPAFIFNDEAFSPVSAGRFANSLLAEAEWGGVLQA